MAVGVASGVPEGVTLGVSVGEGEGNGVGVGQGANSQFGPTLPTLDPSRQILASAVHAFRPEPLLPKR